MLPFVAAAIAQGVYFHDYGGAACRGAGFWPGNDTR